jgi:hypothetical protein
MSFIGVLCFWVVSGKLQWIQLLKPVGKLMLHSKDEPFVSTQNFWSSLLVLFNEGYLKVCAKEKF